MNASPPNTVSVTGEPGRKERQTHGSLLSSGLGRLRRLAGLELWRVGEPQPWNVPGVEPITLQTGLGWAAGAIVTFHLACGVAALSFLMAVCLFCLLQLARVRTGRQAMNIAWGLGLCLYGPPLLFFWNIFGPSAITLWLVLAFWLGLFLALTRSAYLQFGRFGAALLAPFLWLGLEYCRSELYYLRFAWVTPGFAFSDSMALPVVGRLGVYGVGFVLMAAAGLVSCLPRAARLPAGAVGLIALGLLTNIPRTPMQGPAGGAPEIRVAGVQLEFPGEEEVEDALNGLVRQAPAAELLVLSEYTFDGPVPERIRAWCRAQRKHLIVGGKQFVSDPAFYDTAFVVGPSGDIVFQQAKAVPIQFFKDGLPAREQRLWESPWGRLGLCICYDLSYSRVMDRLVRLGAQGLVVPTMDVQDWGEGEHRLHARVAPVRAAEYGLPIFRVASSGISQLVARDGRVVATAGFPGQKAMLAGTLRLSPAPVLPWDRRLAPVAVAITALWAAWTFLNAWGPFARLRAKPQGANAPASDKQHPVERALVFL